MNDATFARAQAQYDAMEPPEPEFEPQTRVLRAVVYLTYNDHGARCEDDTIEAVQSPFQAEKDIARALRGRRGGFGYVGGLEYAADNVEVVDAEYMSVAESEA